MIDKAIRLANYTIDTLVIVLLLLGITITADLLYPEIAQEGNKIFEIFALAFYIFYYFILEVTTGKTIGKLLTKTVVVDLNGNKPGVGRILVRSIIRIIPLNELSFIFFSGNARQHL